MSEQFFNRDLSWLKFNGRVLEQAADKDHPLLERVRFLAIFTDNLDEFFMKRVGFLKRVLSRGVSAVGTDQINPGDLLLQIKAVVLEQIKIRQQLFNELSSELAAEGIHFSNWEDLDDNEKAWLKEYFSSRVFPLLTPLAVDSSHPFPFLSNLSFSLGINLKKNKNGENLFARIKIPPSLPQWVRVQLDETTSDYKFISIFSLIHHNLKELFPKMVIDSVVPFRITRSADIGEVSDDVEERLDIVEEELRLRRVAPVVRLEWVGESTPTLDFLEEQLELSKLDIYNVPKNIAFHSMNEIANLPIQKLRYPAHNPKTPQILKESGRDMFSLMREKDFLVHHPYESFSDSVVQMISQAIDDPKVLAIKMTLYRAGENNPIIPLLIRAATEGKQVVAVIELKARFDEARNIHWGEMLEEAGVHVVYGVIGNKIHCKSILVIREEDKGYRYYSHIGTGNYNPSTARLYTDLSLFTSDKKIGQELIEVFNYLTGLSGKKNYEQLLVAPVSMRKRFLDLIEKEITFASKGEPAHIMAKMNSLEDQEICEALYKASQAGVKVDLLVRGFCSLKPGLPVVSENIRVHSVIGRFLEHSRIFYFQSGAKTSEEGKFFIGSADWMYRNLNNRVELVVPISRASHRKELWRILQLGMNDRVRGWRLEPSGDYTRMRELEALPTDAIGSQEELLIKPM